MLCDFKSVFNATHLHPSWVEVFGIEKRPILSEEGSHVPCLFGVVHFLAL